MNERAELRKERQRAKRENDAIDKATSALLHSTDGRSFLWWLLDITRYGQTPFTGNALTTAFACGEQNISQQLLARITEVDPEGFLNLLKERNNVRDRDRDDNGPDDDFDE